MISSTRYYLGIILGYILVIHSSQMISSTRYYLGIILGYILVIHSSQMISPTKYYLGIILGYILVIHSSQMISPTRYYLGNYHTWIYSRYNTWIYPRYHPKWPWIHSSDIIWLIHRHCSEPRPPRRRDIPPRSPRLAEEPPRPGALWATLTWAVSKVMGKPPQEPPLFGIFNHK